MICARRVAIGRQSDVLIRSMNQGHVSWLEATLSPRLVTVQRTAVPLPSGKVRVPIVRAPRSELAPEGPAGSQSRSTLSRSP